MTQPSGPLSPNLNTGSPSIVNTWILLFSYSATTIKHPSLEIQTLVGILNSPSPLPCFPNHFTKFPVCTFHCCYSVISFIYYHNLVIVEECDVDWFVKLFIHTSRTTKSHKLSCVIKYQNTLSIQISHGNNNFNFHCNASWTRRHFSRKVQLAHSI